jgi:hypothetical protein
VEDRRPSVNPSALNAIAVTLRLGSPSGQLSELEAGLAAPAPHDPKHSPARDCLSRRLAVRAGEHPGRCVHFVLALVLVSLKKVIRIDIIEN